MFEAQISLPQEGLDASIADPPKADQPDELLLAYIRSGTRIIESQIPQTQSREVPPEELLTPIKSNVDGAHIPVETHAVTNEFGIHRPPSLGSSITHSAHSASLGLNETGLDRVVRSGKINSEYSQVSTGDHTRRSAGVELTSDKVGVSATRTNYELDDPRSALEARVGVDGENVKYSVQAIDLTAGGDSLVKVRFPREGMQVQHYRGISGESVSAQSNTVEGIRSWGKSTLRREKEEEGGWSASVRLPETAQLPRELRSLNLALPADVVIRPDTDNHNRVVVGRDDRLTAALTNKKTPTVSVASPFSLQLDQNIRWELNADPDAGQTASEDHPDLVRLSVTTEEGTDLALLSLLPGQGGELIAGDGRHSVIALTDPMQARHRVMVFEGENPIITGELHQRESAI